MSERYPSMKVSRSIGGNGYLLSVHKCEFVWITGRDVPCEIRRISQVFSLLCPPAERDAMRTEKIVLGQCFPQLTSGVFKLQIFQTEEMV